MVPEVPSILDRAPGSSVLDMIGRTPLVRLHQFERETPGVELYAKAEWQNPGGSVKDRAAARYAKHVACTRKIRNGISIRISTTTPRTGRRTTTRPHPRSSSRPAGS